MFFTLYNSYGFEVTLNSHYNLIGFNYRLASNKIYEKKKFSPNFFGFKIIRRFVHTKIQIRTHINSNLSTYKIKFVHIKIQNSQQRKKKCEQKNVFSTFFHNSNVHIDLYHHYIFLKDNMLEN